MDNLDRASSAWEKARAYASTIGEADAEADIQDLICDLLHAAAKQNLVPLRVARMAIANFLAEQINEDGLDAEYNVVITYEVTNQR